jgi:hypothetical protein
MKHARTLVVLTLLLSPALASAQGPDGRNFGLGLTLGEPSGITGQYWFDQRHTLAFALGWGYFPHHGPAVFVDYHYNVFTFLKGVTSSPFDLKMYMGLGGKLGFWYYRRSDHYEGVGLGLRIPFGITMVFLRAPFDIFFEIAPAMAFIHPDPFWFDFDAAIGARFYF